MTKRLRTPAALIELFFRTLFGVGDRVTHPRFGDGEVAGRMDGKIEVRFKDAVRTLATRATAS